MPRVGHDIALPLLTHLPRKKTEGALTPCELTVFTLSLKYGCLIEGRRLRLISMLLTYPGAGVLNPVCRESPDGLLKEY